jgi:leader peptidase (prepilin peptidase)/N-methyltransferase
MVSGRFAAVVAVGALLAGVEAILVSRVSPTAALAAFVYLGALGTAASVIDLRTRRLPDQIILPSYPITVVLLAVASGVEQDWWLLVRAVIAAVLVASFYLALGLVFSRGLGLGDVKLGALLAFALGWLGWPTLTTGVLAAWGLAAIALLVLLVIRSDRRDRTIALGPWLCLGALVAVALR